MNQTADADEGASSSARSLGFAGDRLHGLHHRNHWGIIIASLATRNHSLQRFAEFLSIHQFTVHTV